MNLNLKKFDIKSIKSDKVCVFIGKRETGKSFLVKDLLYYHRHLPGTVISAQREPTNSTDIWFRKYLSMMNTHHNW